MAVVAVVALAVVGWLGISPTGPVHSSSTASSSDTTGLAPSSSPSLVVSGPTKNLGAAMSARALAASRAAGVRADEIYLPHASASPARVGQTRETGVVSPFYANDPAPMGLADYGLATSPKGGLVASILNTTSVRGYVDANATGIQGMDLYQSTPDSYGIQLNAVLTNVMLFGTPGYSFWAQDVVTFSPATGVMVLVSNVWNFSGNPISGNAIYDHGPGGTDLYGSLGYYYAAVPIASPVSYPFNLTLTLSSSLSAGRSSVGFEVALTSPTMPSEDFDQPFDHVTFNSISASHPLGASTPSNFTVDGATYNPAGELDDLELDICGPGSGSQVDLGTADATLGLAYLSGADFLSVPSAYDYGSDTAETSIGANVAWSNVSGQGPAGLAKYGTMTTGPSILSGLWGLGAPAGSYAVTMEVDPANAFNFFLYNGTAAFASPIVELREYAPTIATRTFYLMGGHYALWTELADHTESFREIDLTSPLTIWVNLSMGDALGVYTPLWAFSNSELAALAQSGSGTPLDPYILFNAQFGPFSSDFGLYNDLGFPVFPGVFLFGTTASVELLDPPSFAATTSLISPIGASLPAVNDLQYWFWDVQNAAIVNATNISGWFTDAAYYPLAFDPFSVVLYESSQDLLAGNVFYDEGQALLLFSGGDPFDGAVNLGGGHNIVWGNQFLQTPAPGSCPAFPYCSYLMPFGSGLGLEVGEDHDLIYNNLFLTPTTAWLLPMNLYSGAPELFENELWNVTPQPAVTAHFAPTFPKVALRGSIVGGAVQGGNAWWDYGILDNPYNGADNPLGLLPYDERATTLLASPELASSFGCVHFYCASYIYPAGDFAPLTTPSAPVVFVEGGLPAGTPWGGSITCAPPHVGGGDTTSSPCCAPPHNGGGNTSSAPCCAPPHNGGGNTTSAPCCAPPHNGGGNLTGSPCCAPPHNGGGNATSSPCCAPPHNGGGNTTSGPCCAPPHNGGGNSTSSCSTFFYSEFETTSPRFVVGVLPLGFYNWTIYLPAGYATTAGGTFHLVRGGVRLVVPVHVAPGFSALTVRESGVPRATFWQFSVDGTSSSTYPSNTSVNSSAAAFRLALADGTYRFSVAGLPGLVPVPAAGLLNLTGPTVLRIAFHVRTFLVTFPEEGLTNGTLWGIAVSGPIRGVGDQREAIGTRGASVEFQLPNGTYQYRVLGVAARYCSSSSPAPCPVGGFTVHGLGGTVSLTFLVPAAPAFVGPARLPLAAVPSAGGASAVAGSPRTEPIVPCLSRPS